MKTAPQEALLDAEQVRHPMWSPPTEALSLPNHVRTGLTEMAKRLIPLDGRSDVRQVVAWMSDTYDDLIHHKATDPIWLVGVTTWRASIECRTLTEKADFAKNASIRANHVSQREAIKRISTHLTEAIISGV